MDAQPELALVAKALNDHRLEAILIGNMAAALHAAPVSALFRLHRERDGLQIDFMGQIRSYEGVRDRAGVYQIGGQKLLAASLNDIIRSKRAAGRARDLAVIDILERTRNEEAKPQKSGKSRA